MIIQAYADESGGKGQSSVFVFSAVLASATDWINFTDAWRAILDEPKPRPVRYFKMYEAAKCNGQFRGFSETERDDKIRKLLDPMRGLLEVFCIADMAGFEKTLARFNPRPLRDPYFQQFQILIMAITLTLLDLGITEPFEMVFDEHKIFGPKARAWYPFVRECCDEDMHAVMPSDPTFKSDLEFPALQAADMLAWLRRAWNDNRFQQFAWIEKELAQRMYVSKHSQYLDEGRMQGIVNKSFTPEYEDRARKAFAEYQKSHGGARLPYIAGTARNFK